jgi:hypothetical protein
LLQELFFVLRYFEFIQWHWVAVLLPMILIAVGYMIFCFYFLILLVNEINAHKEDEKYYEQNKFASKLVA